MSSELLSLIYNKALDILSRREHSAHELKLKLHKKYEAISEIEEVITKLESNNEKDNTKKTTLRVPNTANLDFGKNRGKQIVEKQWPPK